jgi:hypothetical protein
MHGYMPRMGDLGSSDCRPARWVTVTRGIAAYLGDRTTDDRPPIGTGANVTENVTESNPFYVGGRVKAYTGYYRLAVDDNPPVFYPINDPDHPQPAALAALKTASYGIVVCAYIPANLSEIEAGTDPVDGYGEAGEAQDKPNLHLKDRDLGNIRALIDIRDNPANPNHNEDLKIIILLKTGSAVMVEEFLNADVIIQAWYPGMVGGQAIAELLFGRTMNRNLLGEEINDPGEFADRFPDQVNTPISFTGKVPMTWPRYESTTRRATGNVDVEDVIGQLPFINTGAGGRGITNYDYHYYHGYRWFHRGAALIPTLGTVPSDRIARGDAFLPRYWFGYGLSYNTYTYSNVVVNNDVEHEGKNKIRVTVDVTNHGDIDAHEVVQAYISFENTRLQFDPNARWNQPNPQWGRPLKQLVAFNRVLVPAGETVEQVEMFIDPEDLAYWQVSRNRMRLENIDYTVIVASNADTTLSGTLRIQSTPFRLHNRWSSWFD